MVPPLPCRYFAVVPRLAERTRGLKHLARRHADLADLSDADLRAHCALMSADVQTIAQSAGAGRTQLLA